MAEPACAITKYDCSNEEQKKTISELIDVVNAQQFTDPNNPSFVDIFPWLGGCDMAPIHYVARKADGVICGWMTIIPREWKKKKYIYLSEISVIRIQDESYRGVGKRLHDRLVEDAKAQGDIQFIYLYPLNEKVKDTYINKWGYKQLDPTIEHLFFAVNSYPSKALIEEIKPKDLPRIYTIQAYRYAAEPTRDEALIKLISKNRRNLLAKPELVEELKDTIGRVHMFEEWENDGEDHDMDIPDLEERRKMIADVFAMATGGRRKTRRHKKRRQTRRKRIQRV